NVIREEGDISRVDHRHTLRPPGRTTAAEVEGAFGIGLNSVVCRLSEGRCTNRARAIPAARSAPGQDVFSDWHPHYRNVTLRNSCRLYPGRPEKGRAAGVPGSCQVWDGIVFLPRHSNPPTNATQWRRSDPDARHHNVTHVR